MLRLKNIAVLLAVALCTAAIHGRGTENNADGKQRERQFGAREIAAILDMQAMRDAETIAFLDTNFLHTLENLNDLVDFVPNFPFDDINNNGGALVIDTAAANFRARRVVMGSFPDFWLGPYISFQQGKISFDGLGYDPGTPIDPWGNPYYLFSPIGLLRPTLETVTLELYGDFFTEYTIVSLGSDGVISGDDLFVGFGAGFPHPSRTIISSLRPPVAGPGDNVEIRGFNFGHERGNSTVEYAGEDLPAESIVSWNNWSVVFQVPPDASSGDVVVDLGFKRSNAFPLEIRLENRTRARHWSLYR